ncbi:hypothetical protein [Granulicella sp. L46]|uniref:hypothetical protein n=1 Tax=Granulicella sp. L46 TaxID=1641865 RepID=UPI00131E203D|nr:hypothetical protein [Granulicella sp. L46]
MIDIHPPQKSDHTWKDFFLHIGTIAVGILIAIGLEQAVELIHEHHQRTDLRQGAITDARLYLRDVDENRDANTQQVEDLTARIQQVRETISLHHPLPPPAYRPAFPIETIRLENLAAAKSSGLIHLLSEEEINSAGDAEVAVINSEALKERAQEAATKRVAFEQRFQTAFPSGPFDFSHITPAQLDEYLGLLLEERVRRTETLAYLELMHRGGLAYIKGQRDLDKLRSAEEGGSAH